MTSPLPTIDRYAVEGELGSGAFGAVYRARHLVLDRKVALKVLHPQRASDADVVQRFLREARAVAGLGSPHVAQILDAGTTSDGRAFFAMELFEGEDLAQRLQRKGRLPTHQVLRIGREILSALSVAHAQGIVHRDLKPGNVFLARTPAGEESAKVLDFGISKVRSESPADELTRTGTLLGTPAYMAPEQFRSSRDVDGRADLYALGVLLYESLAGRAPIVATSLHQIIAAKLSEPPPPLAQAAPDVPRAISDVVMRALATEPKDRYASAADMDTALASVEASVSAPGVSLRPSASTSVRPAPTTSAPAAPAGSRVVPWLVGGGVVIAVGVFAALALTLVGIFLVRHELASRRDEPVAAPTPSVPAAPAPAPSLAPPFPVPVPVPWPTPAPVPPTTAPVAPASGAAGGVRVVVSTLGPADEAGAQALADRAGAGLGACRGAARYDETIQFNVLADGRLMESGLHGSSATRECAVAALVAAAPLEGSHAGIVRFAVTLDPR